MPKYLDAFLEDAALDLPPEAMPRYTLTEAAGYLLIPRSTLNSWFFGTAEFEAVLDPAGESSKLLSFENLGEAYMLRRFRVQDEITLKVVKRAIEIAQKELGTEKPLINQSFLTSGRQLFIEKAGRYFNVIEPSQLYIRGFEKFLDRVEYDRESITRLFPSTRSRHLPSPKIVAISPTISFGSPVIADRAVPTAEVDERFRAGESAKELAEDFGCTMHQIEEAIRAEWMFAYGQRRSAA